LPSARNAHVEGAGGALPGVAPRQARTSSLPAPYQLNTSVAACSDFASEIRTCSDGGVELVRRR